MALPVVTYGTYNYGDYANPKAIQYKGGLGEGLAGAAISILKADQINRQKAEDQLKAANEQSLMLSSQFNAQLNAAFGKASAKNRQFLQGLKQEYGDTVKAYKLDKISFEQYEDKITYFQNILNEATQLAGIMKPIIESENDITFEQGRKNDDNRAAILARHGIRTGNYILTSDENGLRVVLPHGAGPSNFTPKSIAASELISNTKYITPEIEYNNLTNPSYGTMLQGVQKTITDNSDFLDIKIDAELDRKLLRINQNKKEAIIEKISKQQGLRNIFIDPKTGKLDKDNMRYYYEDNMGMGLGSYKGTKDQLDAMSMSIAEDMYESMVSMDVLGEKPYKEGGDSVSSRQQDYNSALKAFDDAIFSPTTFYNLNITKSPYQQTNEGAKYLGNGKYEIQTDVTDPDTGQLKKGPIRTIDLKDFDSFQQYAGTIINRHRSLQGTKSGIQEALRVVNQEEYIKQKFEEYQAMIPSLDENLPQESKNRRIVNESLEKENLMGEAKKDSDYKLATTGIITHKGKSYSINLSNNEEKDLDNMMANNYTKYFIRRSDSKLLYYPVIAGESSYKNDRGLMKELRFKRKEALKRLKAKYPTLNF